MMLVTFCWFQFEYILPSMRATFSYFVVSPKTWVFTHLIIKINSMLVSLFMFAC